MKRLFFALVAVVVIYGGYWFYAAQSLQGGIEDWFEERRAQGWETSYSNISVRGFPSRTDVTLTDVSLRAPDGSIGWQAPFFQVLGLSYKQGHVIVAWPDSQTVTTPDGTFDIASDGLRASVIYDDDRILRSNLEATVLNISGPDDAIALAGVNAAIEKVEPTAAEYRLAVSVDSAAVSNPAVSGDAVPDALATLRSQSVITFSDPLTLNNAVTEPPQITDIDTRLTQVNYGALTLKVIGEAEFDTQGLATGEVTLEAENWRDALAGAADRGDIPPELASGAIDILSLIATLNGGRETLDVTFGLDQGRVLLGPLPIGQLPPLRFP